jgi:hypothetical protein
MAMDLNGRDIETAPLPWRLGKFAGPHGTEVAAAVGEWVDGDL